MLMNANFVVCLGKQPKFSIQIKNKIVESSLLCMEIMLNRHLHSVPLVMHFNQYFFLYHIHVT